MAVEALPRPASPRHASSHMEIEGDLTEIRAATAAGGMEAEGHCALPCAPKLPRPGPPFCPPPCPPEPPSATEACGRCGWCWLGQSGARPSASSCAYCCLRSLASRAWVGMGLLVGN